METFGIKLYLINLLQDLADTDSNVVLLSILLVACIIVLDAISSFANIQRKKVGMTSSEEKKHILPNLKLIPVRNYVSDMQGLAGRPDGLISEDGYIIPIEVKPMSNKIRDRYVAQLLVYMRLIEEFEGKKPPYGYLILGKNSRKVKIYNSDKRQEWLQKYIDEIRGFLENGAKIEAKPAQQKCKFCNVRNSCKIKELLSANPDAQIISSTRSNSNEVKKHLNVI